jgi:DmsE family decaheme c-type cytochrome
MTRVPTRVLLLTSVALLGLCPAGASAATGSRPVLTAYQDPPTAQEPAAPAVAPVALAYEGTETCVGCHDDMEGNLTGTGHGSAFFGELSPHGCETCHGPGSAHVEDPEAFSMRLEDRPVDQRNAACQQCHDGDEQLFWKGSEHESRGLSCIDCHSVHAPQSPAAQLQTATVSETCYECHKDVRAEMWKRSHHPVREGQISCADCHNPHGSQTDKMIRAASVNDQCYECHTEKRGPFIWEHAPVRESCLTCHTPHGSNHQKLQTTAVPYLCQQCHTNTRHPGTLYDGDNTASGASPSNRVFNRGCVNCHQSIHGSNHPSSPYLGH